MQIHMYRYYSTIASYIMTLTDSIKHFSRMHRYKEAGPIFVVFFIVRVVVVTLNPNDVKVAT